VLWVSLTCSFSRGPSELPSSSSTTYRVDMEERVKEEDDTVRFPRPLARRRGVCQEVCRHAELRAEPQDALRGLSEHEGPRPSDEIEVDERERGIPGHQHDSPQDLSVEKQHMQCADEHPEQRGHRERRSNRLVVEAEQVKLKREAARG
jgi:hypothetical protein